MLPYLEKLGFNIVGMGTTCIGNSGPLDKSIEKDIIENNLNVSSVLSEIETLKEEYILS